MTNTALYEKLSLVMKSCSYIEKTGENTFHGYSYVTSSDVLERVNDALSSVGLITTVTPTLLDLREVQTAKGNIDKHATVSVTISIIDIENGGLVQISGIGSGQDSGDKAIMKAETAAIKYAYMLSFCIATGDDPEADTNTDLNTQNAVHPNVNETRKRSNTSNTPKPSITDDSHCTDCGCAISSKVSNFSKQRYHMPLCMNCQRNHQASA